MNKTNNQVLTNAVRVQLQIESDEEFRETLAQVLRHGVDCGWTGFIYYTETEQFFDTYRKEILEAFFETLKMNEQSLLGYLTTHVKGLPWFVNESDFLRVITKSDGVEPDVEMTVKSYLAWFALEFIAHQVTFVEAA